MRSSVSSGKGSSWKITAHLPLEANATLVTRITGALRHETALVRAALALVALHIVDDNYLQPEPGTLVA